MSYRAILVVLVVLCTAAHAEIVDTTTTTGEVLYLVNCTGTCTVELLDVYGNLIAARNHSGYEWGSFSGLAAGVYNLTIVEGGATTDSRLVNLGVFNVTFTKQLETKLGKKTVGLALMFGMGLSAVLLGFEGGFMLIGIALLVSADSGYMPQWVVYVIYFIGAVLLGVGIYDLVGGRR